MPEIPALRRNWLLVSMLSARHYGVTVAELAAELGVSAKTVRRDLERLRGVGLMLEETAGEFGRKTWRLKASPGSPSFCFDEAAALYLGRRLLDPLAGTPFWTAAQNAFQKVRATLGEPALRYLDQFAALVHARAFGARDYAAKSDLLDALQVAIEDCKAVHILYQSDRATEPAFRDVYPYGLVYLQHRSALYLVARDPQEDKVKHYKLDRIEAVEVSNFPFPRPADFDLAKYLESSFGIYLGDGEPVRIQVRFAPAVARYVRESVWHPSQTLTPQRDGSLLAEYELSTTAEFKTWILSFGANAVVLAPEELRLEIVRDLTAMVRAYGLSQEKRLVLRRLPKGAAPPERPTS